VGGAQALHEGFVVAVEFKQHVAGGDELLVVIADALQLGYVPDGADGGAADLADALGDIVADGKNLVALLVEQQMVVAEVGSAHVPVEVLGFEVEGIDIGEQSVEDAGQILDLFGVETVWNVGLGGLGAVGGVGGHRKNSSAGSAIGTSGMEEPQLKPVRQLGCE
jgi:hypothetical protein